MFLTKAIESQQVHVAATEADLALVRRFALRDLSPDQVWLGKMRLANTKVDRSGERFTKAYLQRFVETGPGRSVMPGHNYAALPLGRLYKLALAPDGDHFGLDAWYYLNARDEKLISDIELGVLKDVSVGFNAGPRICDLCEKEWTPFAKSACEHWPLREYDGRTCTLTYAESGAHKAELMEASLVWQGCQFDAHAVPKHFLPVATGTGDLVDFTRFWQMGFQPAVEQEDDMNLSEAEAEITRLKGLTLTSEREKALEGKVAELEAKALLSADGEKYHAYLTGDILRMADALDVANKDEGKHKRKQYEAILEALKGSPAAVLEAQRDAIAVEFNARLSGGVGQTGGADGQPPPKSELLERFAGGLL